jgi:hypothetical protein
MFENLEPDHIPEPGDRELGAVKQRAAVRQRNMFLLGAGSGAGAMAVIAILVIAVVSAGSNTKSVDTVGRPDQTTTTVVAPTTTVAQPAQPAAAAQRPASSGSRSRGQASTNTPPPTTSNPVVAYAPPSTGPTYEVDVMNLDGTGQHTLWKADLGNRVSIALQTWSPNGQLLALRTDMAGLTNISTIYMLDRSGRVVQKLSADGQETVAWSPDGTQFAVGGACATGFPSCAIRIYSTPSGQQVASVDKVNSNTGLVWGANNRLATVQSGPNGTQSLYTIAPDNTDARSLTSGSTQSQYGQLAAGPGDRVFYFGVDSGGLNVAKDQTAGGSVHLADSAIAPVSVAPDGSMVAYSTSGTNKLTVIPVDGGTAKTLGPSGTCPAFGPDGHLYFSGNGGIWASNADGTNAKLLVAAPASACPIVTPAQ